MAFILDLCLDLDTYLCMVVWKTVNLSCCRSPYFMTQMLAKGKVLYNLTSVHELPEGWTRH